MNSIQVNQVKKELEDDFGINNFYELQDLSTEDFIQLVRESTILDTFIKEDLEISAISDIKREIFDKISYILFQEQNLTEGIKSELKKSGIIY